MRYFVVRNRDAQDQFASDDGWTDFGHASTVVLKPTKDSEHELQKFKNRLPSNCEVVEVILKPLSDLN